MCTHFHTQFKHFSLFYDFRWNLFLSAPVSLFVSVSVYVFINYCVCVADTVCKGVCSRMLGYCHCNPPPRLHTVTVQSKRSILPSVSTSSLWMPLTPCHCPPPLSLLSQSRPNTAQQRSPLSQSQTASHPPAMSPSAQSTHGKLCVGSVR